VSVLPAGDGSQPIPAGWPSGPNSRWRHRSWPLRSAATLARGGVTFPAEAREQRGAKRPGVASPRPRGRVR
jgi:hypothetical protein